MLLYMLLCGKFVTNLWHLRVGIVAQSAVWRQSLAEI